MRRFTLFATALIAAGTLQTAPADGHAEVMTDVAVTMDDGVTLVADVYVPTAPDGDGDGRYPCVVEVTPYRKETRASEGASYLPGAGIALIEVDARGTGGSEGEYDIVFSVREQADAAAWVEWAATRAEKPDGSPLCEPTVGMYGGSYSGIIQYLVASLPRAGDPGADPDLPAYPEHLAAIAPQRAFGDLYRDILYHGGIFIGSFGAAWSAGATAFYTQPPTSGTDGVPAWSDHLTKNDQVIAQYLNAQFIDARWTSDDTDPPYSQDLYTDSSVLPRIEDLTVPTLHLAGFYDTFTRGQLLTFSRAHALEAERGDRGPNFLIAGPWNHGGTHFIEPDQGFKELLGTWYRTWLEDAPNGEPLPAWIADGFDGAGARVMAFQQRSTTVNPPAPIAAEHGEWRTYDTWPPPGLTARRLYLADRGLLTEERPPDGQASWVTNMTYGTGEIASRWDNALAGLVYLQHDQRTENGKGLTFVTPALEEPLAITGPLSLTLRSFTVGARGEPAGAGSLPGATQFTPPWLDTDFVVKLSDVAPDGTATLVTQGYLRASHRPLVPDESVTIDGEMLIPIHRHTHSSVDPLEPQQIRDYVIEIWPTAKTFPAGHWLRLDIASSDTPNHLGIITPVQNWLVTGSSYLSIPTLE